MLKLLEKWLTWTETTCYRPGWQSDEGRTSQMPVRLTVGVRGGGSTPEALASVAGFSGILTWP